MTDLAVLVCVAFDHRASAEGLKRFKKRVLRCPCVEGAIEVSGSFDLIAQVRFASHAEYTENFDKLRPQLAEFIARIETNFIVGNFDNRPDSSDTIALWLPCEGGRKRVEARLIDKIVAEGDYMRVHVGDWNCLAHFTMQRLNQQLRGPSFVKLHRSTLVRVGFIDRLLHDERRWMARLRDGTWVAVSKSHVREVLDLMSDGSSKLRPDSSKKSTTSDERSTSNEPRIRMPV
ncbi:MAG: LytTR family transcriptional regulator DNA-binding domain-containing protein [Sphingomicrobium sp.]